MPSEHPHEATPAGPTPAVSEPSPDDMSSMYARWLAATTPNEPHRLLTYFVGAWHTRARLFWNGDGDVPMVSHGDAYAECILGGRFLQLEYAGTVAVPAAIPDRTGEYRLVDVQGLQTIGYDNYRNQFVGTWIDSMSTAIQTFRGSRAETDPPSLILYGQQDEPVLGVTGRMVKYVYRLFDDDRFVFEMFDLMNGHDHKVMDIAYTRAHLTSDESIAAESDDE